MTPNFKTIDQFFGMLLTAGPAQTMHPAQYTKYRLTVFTGATENFTLRLSELGPYDLLCLPGVSSKFLKDLERLRPCIIPRQQARLKAAYAYLNDLQARQSAALEQIQAETFLSGLKRELGAWVDENPEGWARIQTFINNN